jgi:hypothetical protein
MSGITAFGPLGRPPDPHEHRKQHATDTMGKHRPATSTSTQTSRNGRGSPRLVQIPSALRVRLCFALWRLCLRGSSLVACCLPFRLAVAGPRASGVVLYTLLRLWPAFMCWRGRYTYALVVTSAPHVKAFRSRNPPRFCPFRRRVYDRNPVSPELTPSSARTSSKRFRSCGG